MARKWEHGRIVASMEMMNAERFPFSFFQSLSHEPRGFMGSCLIAEQVELGNG
jgi:hypothetical protein